MGTNYSQHLLIRTLLGSKTVFELANVRIVRQILLGSDVHGTKKFVRIRECSSSESRFCLKKMMIPSNKRFTNRVTRSVLEIRSPHFYEKDRYKS